jgi:DNA-binding response OmpR family regulator
LALGTNPAREELFALVRPGGKFGSRRVVDNAVVELRRQLEEDPEQPRFVLTVRGLGYRLAWENLKAP